MRTTARVRRKKIVPKEHKANTCSREAYMFAKKLKGFKRDDVNNWPGYCKIVNVIFDVISEHITNNREGVYIKDLGYFGALLYQPTSKGVRYTVGKEVEYAINSHTDGAVMCLNFLPISERRSKAMETFIMDGTFSGATISRFVNNLYEGFKYKNNAPLFYRI